MDEEAFTHFTNLGARVLVPDLPEETAQVTINEEDLYEYDNTLYKKVVTDEVEGYEVYGTIEEGSKD